MRNPRSMLVELLTVIVLVCQVQAINTAPTFQINTPIEPQIIADGGDIPADAQAIINLVKRGLPIAPDGYTPKKISCPSELPRIRKANEVSPQEKAWLPRRRFKSAGPMKNFLKRMNIDGFDSDKYMDKVAQKTYKDMPNIGIAFSGGGYRALLNGAGAMAAFDSRTPGALDKGGLGGLLQSATYVSGLSGGGWLVGSVFVNNFTSVEDLVNANLTTGPQPGLWNFDRSIVEGPKSRWMGGMFSIAEYWVDIVQTVLKKRSSTFEVSVTDFWSRALAHQMINTSAAGVDITWSSIAEQPGFPEGEIPMPILVANGRSPGTVIVSRNATVFEFSPYELGSWDPNLYGMAPMKYMGSEYEAGNLVNNNCVAGLDNAGFVMGTSSSMFNMVATKIVQGAGGIRLAMFDNLMNDLALRLTGDDNDIASWSPNPFYKWRDGEAGAASKRLSLVDGGEDDQNVPLTPLIQPVREVDVIFAVDSSADTIATGSTVAVPLGNWPNGTSIQATYLRSRSDMANGTGFPAVPDANTFINLGLNNVPSFFGCDTGNMSTPTPPLIVYLPNSPYTFWSNLSTLTSAVPDSQSKAMIHNGYNVATMANGTRYPYWGQCIACAVLSRSWTRTKTAVPKRCQECFTRFCWNGTLADKPVKYDPSMFGSEESPPLTVPEMSQGLATGRVANTQSVFVAALFGMAAAMAGGQIFFY